MPLVGQLKKFYEYATELGKRLYTLSELSLVLEKLGMHLNI
jgi:hypothetical protein